MGLESERIALGRVVLSSRAPLRDAAGQVTGLCGVATDITERAQAEEAQRASDLRYRALFEHAPDGILIADENGQYIDANANALSLLGYRRNELLGLQLLNLLDPSDTELARPSPGQPSRAANLRREWRLRRRDGTTFPAEVTASAMPDGKLLVMLRDITERKRAEARFRRLVDSDAHGVMFWNQQGMVSGGNDAFVRISGCCRRALERGEVQIPQLLEPGGEEATRLDFAQLEGTAPQERELVRADGTRIPVLVGATPFEDNPAEGVCFLIDLSESKRLEQQFLRSQRPESIGTLAGGIAHDLNNALGPIQMALDLIEPMVGTSAGKSLVATVRAGAQRGADMVRQLLTFARGGMEGKRVAVQLRHLVAEVAKIANDTFLKHISVRTMLPRNLPTVAGDPTQLHQLLLNLCVNARDAMPDGGTLTLSAESVDLDQAHATSLGEPEAKPGRYLCVSVKDTGTGMTPAILEKIFDPFFTTKEPGKGTGLGLSTSLAIVKSHGGFLRVTSEPERGSRFDIYLPAETTPAAEAGSDGPASPPRGAGQLILVVDDEASIRQITQQALEFYGYRVKLASDGAEAVAAVAQPGSDIKLMLTDMMMPIMDGPSCIRVIRRLRPELPIIAASGLAANAQAPQQLADLGVTSFLVKPYSSEAMLTEIARVLQLKKSGAGPAAP
ncbi:MAG: PAS domain S-box protein [Verrucomicrobia bacterium]|nr:PAS domain S-box protein [Verrucomicrobiota bacterium]